MTERALPVTILEPAGIDPELLDHTLSLRFDLGQFDPRITFTRNSSATYFGSDGLLKTASANEPRIDYDPVTGECKGFLVEESRTNLLTYSEQFDNATWNKPFNTVTLTNEILSPTGAANAYKIVRTSTAEPLALRKTGLSLPAGTTYSASIYIYVPEQSGVTSWSMTNDYADIESGSTPAYTVFNKWVRVSTTSTLGAVRNFIDFNVRVNGTQSPSVGFVFYAWGAQLEVGSFPTSYIKTEATAVTRAADRAVMTGENFSSWYSQSEGTILLEMMWPTTSSGSASSGVCFSDNTATNFIRLSRAGAGATPQMVVYTNGVSQAGPYAGNVSANTFFKMVGAYKTDDFSIALNGVQTANSTDTVGNLPLVDRLYFGDHVGNTTARHMKRLSYYPKRLANANLQALTA